VIRDTTVTLEAGIDYLIPGTINFEFIAGWLSKNAILNFKLTNHIRQNNLRNAIGYFIIISVMCFVDNQHEIYGSWLASTLAFSSQCLSLAVLTLVFK